MTLTNQWMNTKKHGRDNKEIKCDKKKVLAERKLARQNKTLVNKKPKLASKPKTYHKSKISELNQPEVIMEARVDESSGTDSDFDSKLVSPAVKKIYTALWVTLHLPR